MLIATVDNHEPDALFPKPTGGVWATLATFLTVLFRGNQAAADLAPRFKDAELLTQFGSRLIATQLEAARGPGGRARG